MASIKVDYNKTLEQIDGEPTPVVIADTHVIETTSRLRKKPLKDFTVEDIRIMISQNFNLKILIPLAIAQLKLDIVSEGDFYPGDLLKSVLDSDRTYWEQNSDQWNLIKELYRTNRAIFESNNLYRSLRLSFDDFDRINP